MFTIIGLGEQGKAILHYLLKNTYEDITTIDALAKPSLGFKTDPKRWTHVKRYFTTSMLSCNAGGVVINCVDPSWSLAIAHQCLHARANYIDLGGDTKVAEEVSSECHAKAKHRSLVFVPDCGVAPGLVSTLARDLSYSVHRDGLKIFCGGLPQKPTPPLSYIKTFDVKGLLREYSGVAEFRRNGLLTKAPTLSERELVFVPGFGVLEADFTSGGLSTTPRVLKEYANLEYKTLRYAGHWDYVKENILTQANPEEVLDSLLHPVNFSRRDVLILQYEIFTREGKRCLSNGWYWEYDQDTRLSAMAQATGYTAGAVARMIDHGETQGYGVTPMHEFPWVKLTNHMKDMPNQFIPLETGL